jgi:TolA-binding protein
MAQYQIGLIDARTGKSDDAAKIFRSLADRSSVFVPRPLALLELARVLSASNPKEAVAVYQKVKTEFPMTSMADQADRDLEMLGAKS